MNTTHAQREAVHAEGDVLVAAGAGAGKTSTLVARCVRLIAEGGSLENILMVTFTEAAAAEMRGRIRKALEEVRSAERGMRNDETGSVFRVSHSALEEQLALLDTAPISTLHGFCFQLVRRNFHQLDLDPQLTVLDEAQGTVLMEETLDELLRRHYTVAGGLGGAVEQLILTHAGGREEPVRDLILKIHRYTQTLPDPGAWIDAQLKVFGEREPVAWRAWLLEALHAWREEWRGPLRAQSLNKVAQEIAARLDELSGNSTREEFASVLKEIPKAKEVKAAQRQPEAFFEETDFLRDVTVVRDGVDPLGQDWEWSRAGMETVLLLAREFAARFAEAKREQAALDFNDLEQFALRLLWDSAADAPTATGRACRDQFHHVFVDECQDINAAQDAIIRAVSRITPGNRFLVGDVKQSIYRFRLADPRIFSTYAERWRAATDGRVIGLSENFRSREALLDFFNAVFADLMQPEIGRVEFDDAAKLLFGAREKRHALSLAESPGPRVHLHLRLTVATNHDGETEGDSDLAELSGAEHEARIVANRVRELRDQGHQIADGDGQRAADWGDMAVLLRAPGVKAEIYAREFARQNIPLEVAPGDFFDTLEISDLLNVLMLLDNPLQDVPLLAVLHSPLAGLTADDLATVRLAQRGGYFWTALNAFHGTGRASPAWPKVDQFLERLGRWRSMSRDSSIGQRLETILAETHYLEWLAAQAPNPQRAEQRLSNVRRLLTLARRFDPFQRQGVPRFLRFVEAQRAVAGREPLAGSGGAVQLISIHRSKGLEYPVVVVPDLGKRFNLDDLKANIALHERFGVCPRIKPPHTGQRYPSLTHWLYAKHERSELLGEEMRLLYVALTRARDTLLLVGTASQKRATEVWPERGSSPTELLASNSMLDWLGPWFTRQTGGVDWLKEPAGQNALFSWRFYSEEEAPVGNGGETSPAEDAGDGLDFRQPPQSLTWSYPFAAATRESAKTSVSALRRKISEAVEEARPWWRVRPKLERPADGLSAAQVGTAHHTFLEFAELAKLTSEDGVAAEAGRLVAAGVLSAEEAQRLDHRALARFWNSAEGRKWLGALPQLRRELPFAARFSVARLGELGLAAEMLPADEFVVVQGVVDLAVILRDEIWIMDFKTDDITPDEVNAKVEFYTPQLKLYAAALAGIYGRPVTEVALHFLGTGETLPIPVN